MPFYDYKCPKCETVHEIFRAVNNDEKIKCPACNENMIIQFASSGNFALKGSGWSKDGYSTPAAPFQE